MRLTTWLGVATTVVILGACGAPSAIRTPGVGAVRAQSVQPPVISAQILSPNFDYRKGSPVTAIVLHHTAVLSTAEQTARFFQDPKVKVSSHYVVDRTGEIVRCVPDAQRAWHAGVSSFDGQGDVNTYSVGIEISNVGDGVEPYPSAQVKSVVRLVAWLASTYQVPLTRVARHRDIALPAGRKKDTSDNFDEAYVLKAAQAILDGQNMPAYHPKPVPDGYDPTVQVHTVRPGDTYESLGDDFYDSPAMGAAIARENDHRKLVPGTLIALPVTY